MERPQRPRRGRALTDGFRRRMVFRIRNGAALCAERIKHTYAVVIYPDFSLQESTYPAADKKRFMYQLLIIPFFQAIITAVLLLILTA